MEVLLPVVSASGPCVAALGLGWFLRQSVCTETDGETAAKFALWITLPSLILQTFNMVSLSELGLPILAGYTVAVSIPVVLAWLQGKGLHPKERGLLAGVSIGSSVGLAAIPFASVLFPGVGLRAALLCAAVNLLATHLASYMLFATAGAAFPESFEHLDGGKYEGEWKGMLKEGYGVYTYPSGARYEGQWREGVKEGRGVYFFPKGGLYEGEWRGGVMAGVGVRTFSSGKVQAGIWEGGKLVTVMEEIKCALAVEGANEAAAVAKNVVVGGANWGAALQGLAAQPAAWAFLAAGAMVVSGVPLTPTVEAVTRRLAAAHGPLALLAVGLTLGTEKIPNKQVPGISAVLASRLLPPLLLLAAMSSLAQALGFPAVPILLGFLGPLAVCTVAPVTSMALQYAHIFRLNEALAAGLVQSGTVVSLLLMPFLGITATVSAAAGSFLPFTTAVGAAAVSVAMTSFIAAVNAMPSKPRPVNTRVKMVYRGTPQAQQFETQKQKQQISGAVAIDAAAAAAAGGLEGTSSEVAEPNVPHQEEQQLEEERTDASGADTQASTSSSSDKARGWRKSMFKDVGGEEGGGTTPPSPAVGAVKSKPNLRPLAGRAPLRLGFSTRHVAVRARSLSVSFR